MSTARTQGPPRNVDLAAIGEYCAKFGIDRLSTLGFRPPADQGEGRRLEVVVEFAPGSGLSFENTPHVYDELATIYGHRVEIIDLGAVANPLHRRYFLESRKIVYESPSQ